MISLQMIDIKQNDNILNYDQKVMLDKFFSSIFDEEHEYQDIWELKLIRFDTNLEEKIKAYEKYIAISSCIQDIKGNPGLKGNFFLSNLRIIWYATIDKDINLSIGLDTITNIFIKSVPLQGMTEPKHLLTVKAVSPLHTKYEFKFAGFTEKQERIFKKIQEVFRQCVSTKQIRCIDTNLKLINSEFIPLNYEQVKSKYDQFILYENQYQKQVTIILTNIRLIIIHDKSSGVNYGIPWIILESFNKTERDDKNAIEIKIRGVLKHLHIILASVHKADIIKAQRQIKSYSETYNKNPILGIQSTPLDEHSKSKGEVRQSTTKWDIVEIQQTKVNIGRRKNVYNQNNQKGSFQDVQFNQQLGILMEKMPEGVTRRDLWEILRG